MPHHFISVILVNYDLKIIEKLLSEFKNHKFNNRNTYSLIIKIDQLEYFIKDKRHMIYFK